MSWLNTVERDLSSMYVVLNWLQHAVNSMQTRLRWSGVLHLDDNITFRQLCSLCTTKSLHLSPQFDINEVITPVSSVRDLSIYINSNLSMRMQVSRTVSTCFATLRQIWSIRQSVTRPVLQSLVVALTLTRLDYSCSTMASLHFAFLHDLISTG